MKHNSKITFILIAMFFITQLIGLFVIHNYSNGLPLPYGMEPPKDIDTSSSITSIIFSFIIAISIFLLLTKIKAEKFIRLWFFLVTTLALGLSFNALLFRTNVIYASFIALGIALPLAYVKIFKQNILIHNFTELLIYPGISAVFVPILGVLGIIILLFIISLYDIWAVWKSEIMQKMAKYQINNLRIFTGFFIPYTGKKEKAKIKLLKQKYKNEDRLEKEFKKSKIKINLAILGGGDVVFPIIASGVFYINYGLIPALIITLFSTLALLGLFTLARKGKFYPAMPFLTAGIYLGMIFNWILF